MKLVSVIIPCYNVQEYIHDALNSVFDQTYRNVEIICIDNNSTDDTWRILNKIQKKNPLLVIDQELREGANAARNKGLDLAKGEWIQFLDADDLLASTKIEHQMNLVQNSKLDLVFIAAASVKRTLFGRDEIILPLKGDNYLAPFLNRCGNTCSNLWNKRQLELVGNWNETLKSSQETDLMFRLILSGGHYLVDTDALTIIRERESGQISQRNPTEKWKQYIETRINYLNELKLKSETEFKKNKGIYYDFIMVSILTLSKYSMMDALYYYDKIKLQWQSNYSYGFSVLKVYLIKVFGLKLFLKLTNR